MSDTADEPKKSKRNPFAVDEELGDKFVQNAVETYVGFVDLLGFSSVVKRDWSTAVAKYERILTTASALRAHQWHWRSTPEASHPRVNFWSDSAVIVGSDLNGVAKAVQDIQTGALIGASMLSRGCISHGWHTHVPLPSGAYVVSEALVRAVDGEKRAHYPRVIIDRVGALEEAVGREIGKGSGLFVPSEDGLYMVQPFIYQIGDRLEPYEDALVKLIDEYKDDPNRPKYEWMLSRIDYIGRHFEELRAELEPQGDDDD